MDEVLERVQFGETLSRGYPPDFTIRQDNNQIVFFFSHQQSAGPGLVYLKDSGSEEITQVPNTGFTRPRITIKKGDVYVLKTFDGNHFAKLEIMDIVDGEAESHAALLRFQQSPCVSADIGEHFQQLIAAVAECDCINLLAPEECKQIRVTLEDALVDSNRFVVIDKSLATADHESDNIEHWTRHQVQKLISCRLTKPNDQFTLELRMVDLASHAVNAIEIVKGDQADDLCEKAADAVCSLLRHGLQDLNNER